MQRGDEHGALDRKLERALLQQMGQDVGDAEPLPRSGRTASAHRSVFAVTDSAFGVLVERVDEQHLIGKLGAGSDERGERAGEAANSSARPTLAITLWRDGGAVALVLDDLHVAAFAGLLEAEEHGPLSSTTESDRSHESSAKLCRRSTTL